LKIASNALAMMCRMTSSTIPVPVELPVPMVCGGRDHQPARLLRARRTRDVGTISVIEQHRSCRKGDVCGTSSTAATA
jgi:hypothetical protein